MNWNATSSIISRLHASVCGRPADWIWTTSARPSFLNFRSSGMVEYVEKSVAASQKHTPPLAACGKGLRNMFTDCKTAMALYSGQQQKQLSSRPHASVRYSAKKTQLSSRPHASVRYSAGLQACCLPFQKMHVNKGQTNLLDCWPAETQDFIGWPALL